MLLILNVIFVLVAVAMIALILMQRGAGAQAGSGFGGGASATVFGSRGSSSFLTKATKWLAVAFFVITFYMAWQATHGARLADTAAGDLGVMSSIPAAAPDASMDTAPAVPGATATPVVPEASSSAAPAVPEAAAQPPADAPTPAEGG